MASPYHPRRPVAVAAGVGVAALFTAAATALPAAADSHGNGDHGNSADAPGQSQSHGNGYGHSKDNGAQTGSGASSNGQANGQANGHNPPGNNGTVFIHDRPGDTHPHNVPHVSCNFWVDFFNFDNAQSVTVSFAGQAPTGKGTPLGGTTTTTLQADDASGAGHDWDGELAFTADQLGVSSLGAPAHQGYHVKMTVVTNQPGDHKYKVFWLQPCTTAAPTSTQPTSVNSQSTSAGQSTSTGSTQPSSVSGTQVGATTAGQTSRGAQAPQAAAHTNTAVPTEVLGTKFTRGGATPAAAATSSSLPFTGAEIGGMALAAAVALGTGVLLTLAGRRRRRLSPNR